MKTAFDLIRQPLIIGAFVLSTLIVAGAYFGSHWYYGDVELIDIPENSTFVPISPSAASEVNLEGLPAESEQTPIESEATVPTVESESVDDFLAELSDEEIALLTTEVVEETQPVSPFGFGPYPEVPSDYPETVIWEEDIEANISQYGSEAMKAAELMDRILIKLWNQGHRATSASMSSNGLVYPSFPNTVFVQWEYIEELDGTTSRYAGRISGYHGMPDSVLDNLGEGIVPPGITVLDYNSDAIDPYTFLNLN